MHDSLENKYLKKGVENMKIRGDFVTNSSSVSYILTMKKEMGDLWAEHLTKAGYGQLIRFLRKEMLEKGKIVNVNGEELYSMSVRFRSDGDGIDYKDYSKKGTLFDADFSKCSDEEMWGIIYGILIDGEIQQLYCFGATMVDTF
jgi:hypothetical protein